MMTFTQICSGIRARLPLALQFLIETLSYWRRLCRYNASIRTDRDIRKMQYTLLRETHVIEKGMSMQNPRRGFGQEKVRALMRKRIAAVAKATKTVAVVVTRTATMIRRTTTRKMMTS
jgi:hypothetical protein